MTSCIVKGASCSDKLLTTTIKLLSNSSVPIFRLFELIVFTFWPITLLFWFTLTVLIASIPDVQGSCFQEKAPKIHCALPAHHQTADKQS